MSILQMRVMAQTKREKTFETLGRVIAFEFKLYILDTFCMLNIMTLAQAVLEIFCSQGSIGLQWEKKKKVKIMPKS